MADRSAIGGNLNDSMDKATDEVKSVLSKFDWSQLTPDQHTEFTSKLYSIVQQGTNPELQKNTRERTSS